MRCITSRPPKSCNGSFRPSTQCREPARLLDAPKYRLARDSSGTRPARLSSLGRAEEHVITTLERVSTTFTSWRGGVQSSDESAVSYEEGERILAANSVALLGSTRPDRAARILVTMPTEAADDYGLVVELLARGMDCARINCAHDTPINGVKWPPTFDGRPSRSAYVRCADGPSGPKLRTGPIAPGPR